MSSPRISKPTLFLGALGGKLAGLGAGLGEPFRTARLRAGRPGPFHVMTPGYQVGDKVKGAEILSGTFEQAGQSLDVGAQGDPWTVNMPSIAYAEWLHSFDWMNDLLSAGAKTRGKVKEKTAALRARDLVDNWITHYGQWNSFNWNVEILSPRIWSWLVHWSPVLSGDSAGAKAQSRRACVMRQAKYLRSRFKKMPSSVNKIRAAAALTLFGARLTEKSDSYFARGLDWLDDEIERQLLPDGGHISRSPQATFECLDILLTLDLLLADRGVEGSKTLSRTIDRLVPMVAFFLHGDGRLASFHGGNPGRANHIASVLAAAPGEAKPFSYGPHTKYQRLAAGNTILILDGGTTPPLGFDSESHLAPLAMEISTDLGRLVVNCGWNAAQSPSWRRPVRSSAAHSTLTLEERSPGQLLPKSWMSEHWGEAVLEEAGPTKAKRKEQEAGVWVESSHTGYFERSGLAHRRRLFMAADGADIRGEDSLYVPLGHSPLSREERAFDIRFHFHPDVRVSLSQDQSSALLVHKGQAGWRFRTDGGPLKLEDSVYLAEGHKAVRCQQIVVSGRALSDNDGEGRTNRIRWSLRKLESRR
jgi:uncharacterized heparinase superfamily protein